MTSTVDHVVTLHFLIKHIFNITNTITDEKT